MTHASAIASAAALLRSGQASAAFSALAALPDDADTVYLRALSLSAMGRWDEADATFGEAVALSPKPGEVLTNHANMLRRAGRLNDALHRYAEAEGLPGASPQLGQLKAQVLLALGRSAEAQKLLSSLAAERPTDPLLWNTLGKALAALGRYSEASEAYDRAISIRPDFAVARANRARAARLLGEADVEARELCEAARLGGRNADIQAEVARHHARAGRAAESVEAFSRALSIDPGRREFHGELNRFLWEIEEKDRFLESYRRLPPSLPAASKAALFNDAGGLALKARDPASALQFFEGALKERPGDPVALAGLAEASEPGARESRWRTAMDQAPDASAVRLGFAWWLLNQERPEEAEAILQKTTPAPGTEQLLYAYDSTAARMLGRERYAMYYDLDRVTAVRELRPPPRFASLRSFLDAVIEALEPHFRRKVAPVDQTLFGGQQTPGSLWETADQTLLDLRDAMMSAATRFWTELEVAPGHPLHQDPKRPLRYAGAWSVKLTSGGGHTDHVHPAGTFSSANYVMVPESVRRKGNTAGALRLGRPNLDTIDLPAERVILPQEGTLVLFPSYMWHGVEAFEAEQPRITTPADFKAG